MSNRKEYGKPLISFIITVHELSAHTVAKCIGSIINLSLRSYEREIIVVDDGSDGSLINEMHDLRDQIIYIRQKVCGVSATRNIGLRIAEGQYIQFVNGEDRLQNEGYEHCIDIVRYNAPDMVLFDSSSKEQPSETYYIPEPIEGTQLMRHSNIHSEAWSYLFNRRILLDLRFTPGRFHDDDEFTPLLIIRAEKVYSTNVVAYIQHKKNALKGKITDKRIIVKQLNDAESIIFHLQKTAATLTTVDKLALQRRIAQLTMDYIFNIVKLTKSYRQLEERLKRLEAAGLFPLPDKDYTKKYVLLRKFTNSRMTRKMLSLILR